MSEPLTERDIISVDEDGNIHEYRRREDLHRAHLLNVVLFWVGVEVALAGCFWLAWHVARKVIR